MPKISRTQLLIVAGLSTLAVAFVAFALLRPTPQTFEPAYTAAVDSTGARRITIDATSPDAWQYVSLEQDRVVTRSADWDLAVRRFHIITNGGPGFAGDGAAAEIGDVAFAAARIPADDRFIHSRVDSTHPVLERWYRYGFTSHLLTPRPTVFAVRSTRGRIAKLEILGYYCPGPAAGCLTLRYAFVDEPD